MDLSGNNSLHDKTLSGMEDVTCDNINSTTYNGIDKQNIIYINNLQSNAQNQINNLQAQISAITSSTAPAGGYFTIWFESNGGFTISTPYQWSMGGNNKTTNDEPIPIVLSAKLSYAFIHCSSAPTSSGRVDIMVNGNSVYQMSNITNVGMTTFQPNLTINSMDQINAKTILGAGGGNMRIILCFNTTGIKGADGISPSFVIGSVQTLSAGSDAYATITGTQSISVLNLGIPRGPKGSKGDPGDGGAVAESALVIATTAETNVLALYAVVATQAGTITALTGAVSGLSADVSAQQAQITTVLNRTSGMSYGFSGTNFSLGDVWISDGGSGGLSSAVTLSATTDNVFLRLIRAPQIICSTGTSSFNSLVTTYNVEAGADVVSSSGKLILNRSAHGKKIVLYDNNTDNNYNYLGISTSSDSFHSYVNYNVGVDGGAHRFLYADTSSSTKPILTLDYQNTNITANSINLRASGNTSTNRDCGIDVSNISSFSSDLGQISIRGGVINIGNASNASVVNINGVVNMSGANFNIAGTFFSQW